MNSMESREADIERFCPRTCFTPMLEELTNAFSGVADPTRIRLLSLLAHQSEICVCDLVDATGLTQANVSRHLAMLRHAGLVSSRKEGLWVYYSIKKPLNPFERAIVHSVKQAGEESTELREDLERLKLSTCTPASKLVQVEMTIAKPRKKLAETKG